ncbi:MAG: choice-of-anchor D domain-containing protein [Gammaproteobacteria bacterium]|nr:choice-of-anchor D domain-containing protein [Gammaproteobacteria bacterium]
MVRPVFPILTRIIILYLFAALFSLQASARSLVRMETTEGSIDIELFDDRMPLTVDNYLRYVDNNSYTNTFFHRNYIPEATGMPTVLQAGNETYNFDPDRNPVSLLMNDGRQEITAFPPIQLIYDLPNTRGTIAMARLGSVNTDTATSEWFFNLLDNTDIFGESNGGGYAVFGQVLGNGIAILDILADLRTIPVTGLSPSLPLYNFSGLIGVLGSDLAMIPSIQRIPTITTDSNTLYFGQQLTNSQKQLTITVTNRSSADHLLGTITVSGLQQTNFEIILNNNNDGCSGTNTPIPALGSCSFIIQFNPDIVGDYQANIAIPAADTNIPAANVSLSGSGINSAVANIALSTQAIDLGETVINTTANTTLGITNAGSAPLNITDISFSGVNATDFSYNNCIATTIAVGDSCILDIAFSSNNTGSKTATLLITSDDPQNILSEVSLNTTVIPVPIVEITLEVSNLEHDLATPIYFGTLVAKTNPRPPAPNQTRIALVVTGTVAISPVISITGDNSNDFVSSDDCYGPLQPGARCIIQIAFLPEDALIKARSATLNITSEGLNVAAILTGDAIENFPPDIYPAKDGAEITSLNVGFARIDGQISNTFIVTNIGDEDLIISDLQIISNENNLFEVDNQCIDDTIGGYNSGDSCSLIIRYTPDSLGIDNAQLSITSNAKLPTIFLSLSGYGAIAEITPSTTELQFNNTLTGNTNNASVTFTNTGPMDLLIDQMVITGTDANLFSISNNGCSNVLAVDQECPITFAFTPTSSGDKTATFTATPDDANATASVITLSARATVNPEPHIYTTPGSALTFADTYADAHYSNEQSIQIKNIGNQSLNISSIVITNNASASFTLTPSSNCDQLALDAICTQLLQFNPTQEGTLTATLNILSNDPNIPLLSIALSGLGTTSPPSILRFTSIDSYEGSTNTIEFATTSPGDSITNNFEIKNFGGSDLIISSIRIENDSDSNYSITQNCGTLGVDEGNNNCNETVTYTPSAMGVHTATIIVESNDPDSPQIAINISGQTPAPKIGFLSITSFDQATVTISFDTTPVGNSSTNTFEIQNFGDIDLIISSVRLENNTGNNYSISQNCGTLGTNNICSETITYTPSTTGTHSATLIIESNDPDSLQVSFNLTGQTPPPAPDLLFLGTSAYNLTTNTINFDAIPIGNSSTDTFEIRNTGNLDLIISSIRLESDTDNSFSITQNCGTLGVNEGSNSCSETITYTPPAYGIHSATLIIESNDPDLPQKSINISAETSQAKLELFNISSYNQATNTIFFDTTSPGNSSINTFEIRNIGDLNLVISSIRLENDSNNNYNITQNCGTLDTNQGSNRCSETITYSPASIGTHNITLIIESNDPNANPVFIDIKGQTPNLPPTIEVNTNDINFDNTTTGETGSYILDISNYGGGLLDINDILLENNTNNYFDISNDCSNSLASFQRCFATITYTPTLKGRHTVTLIIESTDANTPSVSINVIAQTDPDIVWSISEYDNANGFVNFNTTLIGESTTGELVLGNIGGADLTITSINIEDNIYNSWQITQNCSVLGIDASNNNCTETLSFIPTSVSGRHTATLVIISDDSDLPRIELPITAEAVRDFDGISDAVEDGATNGGDGNNDGTLDREQPHVASFPGIDGRYVTLATENGNKLEEIGLILSSQITYAADQPQAIYGSILLYPHGFFAFNIITQNNGDKATVKIILPEGSQVDRYFKYIPTEATANLVPDFQIGKWILFDYDPVTDTGAVIEDNVITLHFVDGGRGDADYQVNGVIVDPGAPAQIVPSSTLSALGSSGGSGGGCTINSRRGYQDASEWLILALWFIWMGMRRSQHKRRVCEQ